MKVCARILSRLLVVLAVTACAAEAAPTEVSITEERQPTTDPAYYPLDTRTGLTEIDTVLAAVEDGDPQPLRDLFTYTKTACLTVHALGGPPPCREGEAEGSPIEVLPVLGPEGRYLYRDEVNQWPGFDANGIYAIYEVSESAYSDEYYPKGEYGIVLIGKKENEENGVLQVNEDGIVRIDYLFDLSLEMLAGVLERNAAELILAPLP